MADLNGDGKRDLVGCWNYAYRPGRPWDGIICFPRVGGIDKFELGDLTRIGYVDKSGSTDFKHFSKIYMHADLADINEDGLIDLVYSRSGGDTIHLFLNSGRRGPGGMPVFVAEGNLSRQTAAWGPCRAVDINRDGAVDFVIGAIYLRNINPRGWPIKLAKSVKLGAGHNPCFCDVARDGALDAVCLENMLTEDPLAWRDYIGAIPDSPPTPGPRAFQAGRTPTIYLSRGQFREAVA